MLNFLVGSRKFLMVAIFLLVAIYLLLTQKIPAADWMDNMSEVMVAFLGANIAEHVAGIAKTWIDNKKFDDVAKIIKGKNTDEA